MDSTNSIQSWIGNGISAGAIVGTFLGYVPALGALVALIWYLIKIYESATVQRWIALRRTRKIAKLKARVLMMEAQNKGMLPGPGD